MHFNDRILIVDDNADNLMILEELLNLDYTVMSVPSGNDAVCVAPEFLPELVLLDVMMPGMNGVETCRVLRSIPTLSNARVVMLSAKADLKDRLTAYEVGAVDYIAKPFNHSEVVAKVRAWMQMVQQAKVEEIWREAEVARQVVGAAMLNLTSFRDTETGDHLFRVRWYAQLLAEELASAGPYSGCIDDEFLENFYRATPLHDVGKVAIDDKILRKPGPLTMVEFELMQKHTIVGDELLRSAARMLPGAPYLEMAATIARHHHERFDGHGYPDRLSEANIPLPARILCVADVFDALTSKRVYKDAVSVAESARIILAETGKQFDPVVVAAFETRFADLQHAHKRFASNFPLYGCSNPGVAILGDGRLNEWCVGATTRVREASAV